MCNEKKTAHPHAALMLLYAQDAAETEKPWLMWQYKAIAYDGWVACDRHPAWDARREYRRKPRTININGIEVIEPCYNPEHGQMLWTVDIYSYGVFEYKYANDRFSQLRAKRGLLHHTQEAAEQHFKALISFTNRE